MIASNGNTYLNGELMDAAAIEDLDAITDAFVGSIEKALVSAAATTWGSWQRSNLTYFATGGFPAAVIAGYITAHAPWVALSFAMTVASVVAASYTQMAIQWKVRFGFDGQYDVYERVTYLYGVPRSGMLDSLGNFTDQGKLSQYGR